jgi:hypothetical protein
MNHYDFVDLIQGHTKSTNGDIVNGPFRFIILNLMLINLIIINLKPLMNLKVLF